MPRLLKRLIMSARVRQLRFRNATVDTAPDFVVSAALAGVRTALRTLADDPRIMRGRFGEGDGLGCGLSRRRDGGATPRNTATLVPIGSSLKINRK